MRGKETLSHDFAANRKLLDTRLRIDESFDVIGRDMTIGSRPARLYFIDGFAKDEMMEKMMEFLIKLTADDLSTVHTTEEFSAKFISYIESDVATDAENIVTSILSGMLALVVDGFEGAVMIDARTYPVRGVSEPEDDRVLRGSHDGFVETLVFNTALIRRRIRDPGLTMDIHQVGSKSKTDIVLCYLKSAVDPAYLEKITKKLESIRIDTLTMGQESLAECLVRKHWYNPFPKIRYTERPDAVAASVVEGSIAVIVDNSPSVMLLPVSIFDFIQDTNDYYFPPLVGSYLRFVRMGIFALTVLLTPIWYLLIQNPGWIPPWLDFIKVQEPNAVPIIFQLLVIEFVIDGLKLASLNTPSVLSNSFSIVGALILGDFAVKARWFVPEVVLYMAFVAISTFTQPSFELGWAFKLFRVLILILTAIFGVWGFAAGILLTILAVAFTKTPGGKSYLYPLIPFNWKALKRLLIRQPISRQDT